MSWKALNNNSNNDNHYGCYYYYYCYCYLFIIIQHYYVTQQSVAKAHMMLLRFL